MTANEAYQQYRQEIDLKMELIKVAFEKVDKAQSTNKSNWGFAGTTLSIENNLDEIIDRLNSVAG